MHRKLILCIGAMRSGKSFFSDHYIRQYIRKGNSALVYNLGKTTDFQNSKNHIRLLNEEQHANIIGKKKFKESPKFRFFEDQKGKVQDFKNFNKLYLGKSAKTEKLGRNFERRFIDSFYKYCSNTLLVLDDARSIFRYGMNDNFLNLFSRINHTGKESPFKSWQNKGSDIIIIFHSLNHVNPELLDYATHIINFKYAFEPDFSRLDNREIQRQMKNSFKALKSAKPYFYTITDIHKMKTFLFNPINF